MAGERWTSEVQEEGLGTVRAGVSLQRGQSLAGGWRGGHVTCK